MTTFFTEPKTCAVCGVDFDVTVLGSSTQLAPPDLDLRPGEMVRSTIDHWVQECPSCGYCMADVSVAQPHAAALVRSTDYQTLRKGSDYNPLASRFLRCGTILEASADYVAAFNSVLRAAWACDDGEIPEDLSGAVS